MTPVKLRSRPLHTETDDLGEWCQVLRFRVLAELQSAGFVLNGAGLQLPDDLGDEKDVARALHRLQRAAVLEKNRSFLEKWESRLLEHFADGTEVRAECIAPKIVPVETEEDGALFRFASLHWAVPVSQGYGRRTRFLVRDEANGKLIGLFALGDPVFNLRVRDALIGWDQEQRRRRLYNVFDAYVLGAVSPYRELIAGKLIAFCAVAAETADHIVRKYDGTTTLIRKEEKDASPVLITTTSALGRSSIYNRLKYEGQLVFRPIGYTQGFGHFHFSDDLFTDLALFLVARGHEVRGNRYGDGPNWRIRTLRRGLEELGLAGDLLRHGIRREVFAAPRAAGWRAFLREESSFLKWYDYSLQPMANFWRERWAIPRAGRDERFRACRREQMRLTPLLATPEGTLFEFEELLGREATTETL